MLQLRIRSVARLGPARRTLQRELFAVVMTSLILVLVFVPQHR
jgi:hypothetical protein